MKSLSQMTEEELKTLCKSLEERYGENSTITLKQSDFNNMWDSIDRYAKENKRLQDENKKLKERIKDANEIVEDIYNYQCVTCSRVGGCMSCGNRYAGRYMKKWGVK